MDDGELTRLSATALAAAIRSGRVTAREVVEEHIALLAAANPAINAVVADRYDEARKEADAADARVARAAPGDPLPPLLGVPCTVKESIAVAGLPNSAGVVARRDVVATDSAPVVRRVRAAGAIVLGVTNTSELCLWVEAENRLYGRTRNPYDTGRTAGGSSGGEGAAIGSGGSPVGLGSDIGGSIRIPAFCCGVFGHKPSRGLVPSTGSYPAVSAAIADLFTPGPLARRAEDLMPLLRLMSGPDGVDPLVTAVDLGDLSRVRLAGRTVVVSDDAWPLPTSDELLAARERAAGALAAAGARVVHRRMPHLRRAWDLYITTLARSSDLAARDVLYAAGADPVSVRDLLRRGGPHTVATRVLLVAEQVHGRIPHGWARRMMARGRALARELCAAVDDAILLHPPLATVAPRHGRTVGRPWWLGHAVPFNLAGVPVTQVPLGLSPSGLPLGVQVAAGQGDDHLTIAAALELERAFGGWVPPRLPVEPPASVAGQVAG